MLVNTLTDVNKWHLIVKCYQYFLCALIDSTLMDQQLTKIYNDWLFLNKVTLNQTIRLELAWPKKYFLIIHVINSLGQQIHRLPADQD